MATGAPVATARGVPEGIPLFDGKSTLITFAGDPTIEFWEKTVTPPGIDTGDPIDVSTMHNTEWRTMYTRKLKTLTPSTVTAAYDPQIYTALIAIMGINDVITITFPDGSTIAFYGIVQTAEPGDNAEGEQPEMTITITPTNIDGAGAEQAPVVVEVAGT